MGGVDQREKGENLISNRSLVVSLNLSDTLIQIISRREDYRLYVYRIIESSKLVCFSPFLFIADIEMYLRRKGTSNSHLNVFLIYYSRVLL